MLSDQFQELLKKEMDRKQFMAHVGMGLLGVIGVSAFIKTLLHGTDSYASANNRIRTDIGQPKRVASGYGGSAYGK